MDYQKSKFYLDLPKSQQSMFDYYMKNPDIQIEFFADVKAAINNYYLSVSNPVAAYCFWQKHFDIKWIDDVYMLTKTIDHLKSGIKTAVSLITGNNRFAKLVKFLTPKIDDGNELIAIYQLLVKNLDHDNFYNYNCYYILNCIKQNNKHDALKMVDHLFADSLIYAIKAVIYEHFQDYSLALEYYQKCFKVKLPENTDLTDQQLINKYLDLVGLADTAANKTLLAFQLNILE